MVIHLRGFWYQMHWGGIPTVNYNGEEVKNLYATVETAYSQGWFVALYVFSMAVLAFHLWHGFVSAFQTLGWNHKKYNPVIAFVGKAFSIIVPALFCFNTCMDVFGLSRVIMSCMYSQLFKPRNLDL